MVFNNIRVAKKYFDNINIDLIYAVDEDIDIVKEDLNNYVSIEEYMVHFIDSYSNIYAKRDQGMVFRLLYQPQ